MARKYIFIFSISLVCFFSCSKDNTSPQGLIIGKWTLQQQHAVLNIDNARQKDTILAASATTYASAQFNDNGTFSSASVYNPGTNLFTAWPGPSTANTTGKYSYSGAAFTITPGLAGWVNFGVGSTGPPTGVSSSIEITQLDRSHLTIHSENSFTITTGTGMHTYNEVFDLYYSK
jgi:hypothetical protein